MKKIEYDLPVFENEDMANLNEYSQKVADAIKVQIDKFGQPLTFKGTLDNFAELEAVTEKKNGDIYEIKDIEELYIYNGTEWVIYSDTLKIKIEGFEVIVAEELPTENIQEKTIYLVPSAKQEEENIYDEFMYVNNKWEQIGSTAVDLTDYYTKTEVDNKIDNIQTLPSGGTEGQVLTKASSVEGDAEWRDITGDEVYVGNVKDAPESAKIIIEDEFVDEEEGNTEYSSMEQVIGKWIDGKTLYRKTIKLSPMETGFGTYNHDIQNVEKIWCDVSATFFNDGTWSFYQETWAGDSRFDVIVSNSQILYTVYQAGDLYVTLNYTKTTD